MRPAMITPDHCDQVLPPGSPLDQLDGHLDGLAAGIPEEERVQARVGHEGDEGLDETEVREGEGDGALDVGDLGGLGDYRSSDGRVAAGEEGEDVNPNRRHERYDRVEGGSSEKVRGGETRQDVLPKVDHCDTRSKVQKLPSILVPDPARFPLDEYVIPQPPQGRGDVCLPQ